MSPGHERCSAPGRGAGPLAAGGCCDQRLHPAPGGESWSGAGEADATFARGWAPAAASAGPSFDTVPRFMSKSLAAPRLLSAAREATLTRPALRWLDLGR